VRWRHDDPDEQLECVWTVCLVLTFGVSPSVTRHGFQLSTLGGTGE
jgi:hypothetical protein